MTGAGYRPKLIEVALPLAAINAEAAREKSIRHGHPSTLHLWWARRPLAAARAVVWASLVDDPSGYDEFAPPDDETDEQRAEREAAIDAERRRLFAILERLVVWENSNNSDVLAEARAEIDRCWPDGPPAVLDPFAGGGAIPLEAQRLGLTALAGDLNPVAVLINKAMIEIPPRFAGRPPVHPDIDKTLTTWERAQGLAADVEAYGAWMRDEAQRRIGHLYPDAEGPGGEKLTPIAWIWARTVESPDPSWSGQVPLVASWTLAKRPGKPKVWIEPIIDRSTQTISYEIRQGGEPTHERTVGRQGGYCIATGAAVPLKYIRAEGQSRRLGCTLLAVVAESPHGRTYCGAADQPGITHTHTHTHTHTFGAMPVKHRNFQPPGYGIADLAQLFTPRQLTALTTFSDLLGEAAARVRADAAAAGMASDGVRADAAAGLAADGMRPRGGEAGADGVRADAAAGFAVDGARLRGGGAGADGVRADAAAGFAVDGARPRGGGAGADGVRADAAAGLAADGARPRGGGAGADGVRLRGGGQGAGDAAAGLAADGVRLRDGGAGADAYADAVVTYLAFAVDRMVDRNSTICSWDASRQHARNVFARQAIPMTWDFAENNPLGASSGSWSNSVSGIVKAVERLPAAGVGRVAQRDARARVRESVGAVVSTDPPYYDNISYADLSDFFYVWLRRNLGDVWPDECSTLLSPKSEELIANRYRAGSKARAEEHFESGMAGFMAEVAERQPGGVPATVYYAYKATETRDGEIRTTGWDTFLQAVIDAGLEVNATWPMRTELGNRLVASGANALASSIVLACRPRPESAVLASRGEFLAVLRRELPGAVRVLQSGNIAPVDMAQSAIGPGIGVFSRYARVVEADGSSMPVSVALAVINDVLGEVLDGAEAELDADSRFALTWYSEHGYDPGPSGDADSVARAKNTSLAGIQASGIGEARAGRFRLYERGELDPGWSPLHDERLTVWESAQHLAAALERSESEAAELLHALGGFGDRARQLAYLLYQKADDRGWATEAGAFNGLIAVWPDLRTAAATVAAAATGPAQQTLM